MKELIMISLSTFASEDLALLAAGALVARGRHRFLPATIACILGIFFGDLILYALGRFAEATVVHNLANEQAIRDAAAWLTSNGAWVAFVSRFTPGTRLPTYLAAGLLGVNIWLFAAWLLIAAVAWTPILVTAGYLVTPKAALPAWLRKYRWEFWPIWATYLPLLPYLLYLAIKHRSPTVFMSANPGIHNGGAYGESKFEILRALDPSVVAPYRLLPAKLAPNARIQQANEFRTQFPVVLKPDVGERGNGVAIIRSQPELEAYLRNATTDTIIQQYVSGHEYGLFYYRMPGEAKGHLFSITEKHFPHVTGDGASTICQLIENDPRAACLTSMYCARLRRNPSDIPAPGERVPIAELGSHCKGAIFLDGRHLHTPELEAAVDRISKSHPGFYFGRYDVRSASPEHLQQGMFQVLELNGVTAEATHIYDPAVTIVDAYRTLAAQWRIAFEIGAALRHNSRRVGCLLPQQPWELS
ncbi:MAG: VTT domain-containing protein [Bryobacteraceae bacterium]